jgi:adenine-specific DNA-methyltransferase
VLSESNEYFDAGTVTRVIKAATATVWDSGKAVTVDGPGIAVRVQSVEQYEDTLENLALEPESGGESELGFEDAATLLRWQLDEEAKRVYCAIDRFRSPFGYRLKRAHGAGAAEPVEVDLVESLVWLLGLDVATMHREPQGVAMTGKNRRGESVLVAFRDCDAKGSGDWVLRMLAEHPADRVYTNDPADLAFAGAEKLESIEAVFATQFGGTA